MIHFNWISAFQDSKGVCLFPNLFCLISQPNLYSWIHRCWCDCVGRLPIELLLLRPVRVLSVKTLLDVWSVLSLFSSELTDDWFSLFSLGFSGSCVKPCLDICYLIIRQSNYLSKMRINVGFKAYKLNATSVIRSK